MKLKKLEENQDYSHDEQYKYDCEKIQIVLLKKGYIPTLNDCYDLWDKFSDSMAAGWINLPEDEEEIWYSINSYIDV